MDDETASAQQLWQLSAHELARRIAAREVSAVAVTESHLSRIAEVNPQINAVVAPLYDEARQAAAQADATLRERGPLGPLHGVPFTVKECFDVRGTAATLGVHRWQSERASSDGPLVTKLRQAGGILLGKTNVGQLMLSYETDNPLFGPTRNPWNLARSPGGSSGGEAALIAAGGSPLGLASDLGGSIRQPAHCCGIAGFLPTPGWLTTDGMRTNVPFLTSLIVQPGFLARTVADVRVGLQAVGVGMATNESGIAGQRIGYWVDDGYFSPSPSIRRAVREAANALKDAGADVREFQPPQAAEALFLFFALLSADGGDTFREMLGDSPPGPRVARLLRLSSLPKWLHALVGWAAKLRGNRRLGNILARTGRRSPSQLAELVSAQREFQSQFAQAMQRAGVDLLLSPAYTVPALRHGAADNLPGAACYCILMNILGFPCGTVPVTTVQPGEESDRLPGRDPSDRAAKWVESGSAGMPIGVQVAAPAGQDLAVLNALETLEKHFRSQRSFPRTPVSVAS